MCCASLLLAGCAVNQKIAYRLDTLAPFYSRGTIPVNVEFRELTDIRATNQDNAVFLTKSKEYRSDSARLYINSEKHYVKEPVSRQVSRMAAEHLNASGLFRSVTFGDCAGCEYYISGNLYQFTGYQKISVGSMIASQFGLIGALAASGNTTPGVVTIIISDLGLYRKDGTLIKDMGTFKADYCEEFPVDAYGWCIYWNVNAKLASYNSTLVKTIESILSDVYL